MKIRFQIVCFTRWGQSLKVCGSVPVLGSWDLAKAPVMYSKDSGKGLWDVDLDVDSGSIKSFEYKYVLFESGSNTCSWEWGANRKLTVSRAGFDMFQINDFWREYSPEDNALYSSAFTKVLLRPEMHVSRKVLPGGAGRNKRIVRFRVSSLRIEPGHRLCILGNVSALGEWNEKRIVRMENSEHPVWERDVDLESDDLSLQYKYCIYDEKMQKVVCWEHGENRLLDLASVSSSKTITIQTDSRFRFETSEWKGAGVAIPVFSLRSHESFGVGEFLDLKKMVDWAKSVGLKMIQILPVNDTVATHTWVDSYPYAAISVFALHPIYINLRAIGVLASKTTCEIMEVQRRQLNDLKQLDYETVMRLKSRYLKLIFDEVSAEFLLDPEFGKFFEKNRFWLVPYAAFSYLRDLYGTPDFNKWGRYKKFTSGLLDEVTNPDAPQYADIAVHYFIQYHLHRQLLEAAEYARTNGVILKGDIPIGIYRHSVDAWMSPNLFNVDSQAGAPPDDFSERGQNWRFPTYNWRAMAEDGFGWWVSRLRKIADYFDAFRLDHILGFFRIWEIPCESLEGVMGYFNPALAVHISEIEQRGINFDHNRFCRPYIRKHMLGAIFGDMADHVEHTYLEEYWPGCYRFRPQFDTQQKVDESLKPGVQATHEERAYNERLKNGLLSLHGEVLFFDAPFSNGNTFNPRHSLNKTWSYRELDSFARGKLDELYNDYFYKRNESYWRAQALAKLPAIKDATDMLICGEDLGMVPACVPQVMSELGILSLEVQRMPKKTRNEFGHPADYPYLSVATPSSHDTSTVRGWWEEDPVRSQRFYNTILGKSGDAPSSCEPWLVRAIITQHLYSPSMWAVFPLQDLLGMDEKLRCPAAAAERINEPAISQHYWRYRMHIFLEELIKEHGFNSSLSGQVKAAGRCL
ncbi:MAG: hypothetical protein A2283_14305 [Lentisphaerae bacterium RIFOXYA12_FULL_48_11]|nr:MAG: hypothetical protein A2283_14305 [Lentisphaerae bacterium RIFOXYA12_FULL_48_11]